MEHIAKASLKSAFKAAAKATHPDAKGGSAEDFQKVNQAYTLLKAEMERRVKK